MRIEIAEIENRNIYRVWYGGGVIVERTGSPMVAAARILLRRGADPGEVLEMVRRGRDQVDMCGTIGAAARADAGQRADCAVTHASNEDGGSKGSPRLPATPDAAGICDRIICDRIICDTTRESACVICGKAFTSVRVDALYCSPRCRQHALRQRRAS